MNMKNAGLILNIVLIIAVGVLYYLHFKGTGSTDTSTNEGSGLNSVYYINIDTLNENLAFLSERQEVLEKKEIDADVALKQKGAELEKEIMEYQKQVQGGFLTPKQMQSVEQRLTRKQQAIVSERDSIASMLLQESQEINRNLADKLKKHIEEFSKTKECNLVLGYTEGANILYANKNMDITRQILDKMNAEKE
jgi:outer membrane protein